jgi:hypothetical protein
MFKLLKEAALPEPTFAGSTLNLSFLAQLVGNALKHFSYIIAIGAKIS